MNYKNARKAAVLAFLAVSLFSVSGCGSNPEGKIEEKIKLAYPDSFKKEAYEVDKNNQFGYFDFTAKDEDGALKHMRVYFMLSDKNKNGYEFLDEEGDISGKKRDEYYKAASESKDYNFLDCIVFHKELLRYLTDISNNLKHEYDRSVTYDWVLSSNSYYGSDDPHYPAEKQYNHYNDLINEFKDYRDHAPDVVAKSFGDDIYFDNDKIGNYLRYYKIKGRSSGSRLPIIELVNEYPGRYETGNGA